VLITTPDLYEFIYVLYYYVILVQQQQQQLLLLLLLVKHQQGDSDDDDSSNNNNDNNGRRRRTEATRQAHANVERNRRQREQSAFAAVRGVVLGGSQTASQFLDSACSTLQGLRHENQQQQQHLQQQQQLK
jgi:hypothetical protein